MLKLSIVLSFILFVLLYPNPYTLTPAFAQIPCGTSANLKATGLVSTPSIVGGFATSGSCQANDPKAAFAPFKIPTFDDLKSLYFDQAKPSLTSKVEISGNRNQNDLLSQSCGTAIYNGIYYVKKTSPSSTDGNLNIAGPTLGSQTKVVFVEGNLTFSNDYCGADNCGVNTQVASLIGTVFVVKGSVNIEPAVTRIDGIIIASGTIYTAGADCSLAGNPGPNNQLVINGSLISIYKDQQQSLDCSTDPSLSSCPIIKFCRKLADNTQPAEKINHQVKYLVILRHLLSDTYQKWSEISSSEAVPASEPTSNSVPAPEPGPTTPSGSGTTPCNPACGLNASGVLAQNTYLDSQTCTTMLCPFPQRDVCPPDNVCHLDVRGYDGTSCNPNVLICSSNASSFNNQLAVCGANNISACTAAPSGSNITMNNLISPTRRMYLNGSSCTANATCDFPYAPAPGQQTSVCGLRIGTSPIFNDPNGCNSATPGPTVSLRTYYPGYTCNASGTCFPNPIYVCPSGCHGSSTGFNGIDCTGTISCTSNLSSYPDQATSCGIDNINACNAPTGNISMDTSVSPNRRTYYTGATTASSCTQATCGFPYSTRTNGNHDAVCGVTVSNKDPNGCSNSGSSDFSSSSGSLKSYYNGLSCYPTGTCNPNPAGSCASWSQSCHGNLYLFNGTDCNRTVMNCGANFTTSPGYTSYNQTTVCGSNNIDACVAAPSGSGITMDTTVSPNRRKYDSGSSCNTADTTCGFPYAPAPGQQTSVCGTRTGSNDSNGCNNPTPGPSVSLRTFYPGNSCSQSYCFPNPAYTCPSGCHNSLTGFNGIDCTGTFTCPANYPAADACPTTCHAGTVYVFNGDSCDTNVKNKACPGNAPAAQSCPASCHADTQYVPNGSCGLTTCLNNSPAATASVPACRDTIRRTWGINWERFTYGWLSLSFEQNGTGAVLPPARVIEFRNQNTTEVKVSTNGSNLANGDKIQVTYYPDTSIPNGQSQLRVETIPAAGIIIDAKYAQYSGSSCTATVYDPGGIPAEESCSTACSASSYNVRSGTSCGYDKTCPAYNPNPQSSCNYCGGVTTYKDSSCNTQNCPTNYLTQGSCDTNSCHGAYNYTGANSCTANNLTCSSTFTSFSGYSSCSSCSPSCTTSPATCYNGTDCTARSCSNNYPAATASVPACKANIWRTWGINWEKHPYGWLKLDFDSNGTGAIVPSSRYVEFKNQNTTEIRVSTNGSNLANEPDTVKVTYYPDSSIPNGYGQLRVQTEPGQGIAIAANYVQYNGSSCTPTLYTSNCNTFCGSDGVGCYLYSDALYTYGPGTSVTTRTFHWQDSWLNKSTNSIYSTSSSTWNYYIGGSAQRSPNYDWDRNECDNATSWTCPIGSGTSGLYGAIGYGLSIDGFTRTRPTNYPGRDWSNDDSCPPVETHWGDQYCNNVWHSINH